MKYTYTVYQLVPMEGEGREAIIKTAIIMATYRSTYHLQERCYCYPIITASNNRLSRKH